VKGVSQKKRSGSVTSGSGKGKRKAAGENSARYVKPCWQPQTQQVNSSPFFFFFFITVKPRVE